VLCSANDPAQAIKVIHKTLKPGGKLYIIEHVGSQNRARRFLQHALTVRCPINFSLSFFFFKFVFA